MSPKPDPISHVKVIINDDETVEVDSRATQRAYFSAQVNSINEAAFKCANPKCAMVTVHEGMEFQVQYTDSSEVKPCRVYLCTNCGRFATK